MRRILNLQRPTRGGLKAYGRVCFGEHGAVPGVPVEYSFEVLEPAKGIEPPTYGLRKLGAMLPGLEHFLLYPSTSYKLTDSGTCTAFAPI